MKYARYIFEIISSLFNNVEIFCFGDLKGVKGAEKGFIFG